MNRSRPVTIALAGILGMMSSIHSKSHLDASLGFTPSKSTIGFGYGNENHELTIGLKNNFLAVLVNSDRIYQPGISFNRIIAQGYYVSATYAPVFVEMDPQGSVMVKGVSLRDPIVGKIVFWENGWNSGEVFVGGGKTFQGEHWGFAVDANLITPATIDIGKSWSYWVGLGVSWRMHLD